LELALREWSNEAQEAIGHLRRAADGQLSTDLPTLEAERRLPTLCDRFTHQTIASLVRQIGPRHVIELGCGASTELLARLGLEHGRMAVTTFEHDPWAAAEIIAVASPLAINYRWFSFCICPLVARCCGGAIVPVYDDRMALPTVPHPADLIVINGPPQALGGRGGMFHQALKYARPGSLVLLLDARSEEDADIESWLERLEGHIAFVPPGLAGRHLAFVVLAPLREPFTLEDPLSQAAGMGAVSGDEHQQAGAI
jgi:hypothetical protein